jgi:hypothetical protein
MNKRKRAASCLMTQQSRMINPLGVSSAP